MDISSLMAAGQEIVDLINGYYCQPSSATSSHSNFKCASVEGSCGVALYQTHETDSIRPWKGVNINIVDGAARLSLTWFGKPCGEGLGIQGVLLERVREVVGGKCVELLSSVDSSVTCSPTPAVLYVVVSGILRVLLQSTPCSGAYRSKPSDVPLTLLGDVGTLWNNIKGVPIGVTAVVAAGSQHTIDFPSKHVDQLTLQSTVCSGWVPLGSMCCFGCMPLTAQVHNSRRALKDARGLQGTFTHHLTGTAPISNRVAQVTKDGDLKLRKTKLELLTEVSLNTCCVVSCSRMPVQTPICSAD